VLPRPQPIANPFLFTFEGQRFAPPTAQACQPVKLQETAQRRGSQDLALPEKPVYQPGGPAGFQQPRAEGGGHDVGKFLYPGMEKFVDQEYLVFADAHFVAYTIKATTADFEIGHTDRIFIGHPERQVARSLGKQGENILGAMALVPSIDISDRPQTVEILSGIRKVLVVGKALNAGEQNCMAYGREVSRNSFRQLFKIGTWRGRSGPDSFNVRRFGMGGGGEAGSKRLQAGTDRDSATLDRRFKLPALKWQCSIGSERAEKRSADNAVVLRREGGEVALNKNFGCIPSGLQEDCVLGPAVAHRDLLRHGINAVGRGDQGGPIRRDQPARDGPACLHQL